MIKQLSIKLTAKGDRPPAEHTYDLISRRIILLLQDEFGLEVISHDDTSECEE